MKGKNVDYLPKIIKILKQLKDKYPSWDLCRHISTATSDYGDIWGLSDKEFLYLLEKYGEELAMNSPYASEEDVSKIIEDGLNLDYIESDDDY